MRRFKASNEGSMTNMTSEHPAANTPLTREKQYTYVLQIPLDMVRMLGVGSDGFDARG